MVLQTKTFFYPLNGPFTSVRPKQTSSKNQKVSATKNLHIHQFFNPNCSCS